MGIYGNRRVVKRERYAGNNIEILQIIRGAKHCDTDHDVAARTCRLCGTEIRNYITHLIQIDSERFDDPEFESADDALVNAKAWIDQWDQEKTGQDEDDEPGEEDGIATADPKQSGTAKVGDGDVADPKILRVAKALGWGAIAVRIAGEGSKR